ncbi:MULTISPECIES: type II secretion system F family protein [Aeromicrobium]|uniref:type II secretion system F family protein n=1 Tax=Aeromicrobium TaxID=2040 RepID=UPI00257BAA2B|nr:MULTISPECIES: type II secretion system F family protein [Aeromicrobium]
MIAGLLVACALLLVVPGPARRRRRRLRRDAPPRRLDRAVLVAAGVPLAGWMVFGSIGLLAGVAAAPLVHRHVGRWESVGETRRRVLLVREAPLALDLVAAVLAAGRSPHEAVIAVATQTPGPVGHELTALAHRVRLAADPATAWRSLDGDVLEPVGRAFARAEASGAAVVPLIRDAAEDLRRADRAQRREAVGRVGVRTTLPMGLCLLPAFVLVGVAPTVLAVLGSVRF